MRPVIILFAKAPIALGEWVHEHNVEMAEFERDYAFARDARPPEILPVERRATFNGYRRVNGKVATRNYIGILTSVNCSASVARFMAEACNRSGILADYPNVDGVVSFVHGTGCGMAGSGEGFEILKRTQWGYASNPNAIVTFAGNNLPTTCCVDLTGFPTNEPTTYTYHYTLGGEYDLGHKWVASAGFPSGVWMVTP